jgi:hypothetical protein
MYLIMLWVILFVIITGLTGTLLLIALVVIGTPILILPIQYKELKQKYGILLQAGQVLKESESLIDSNQLVTGLTSYVFLVFDILRPANTHDDAKEKNEVEEVRKSLKATTRKIIFEIAFQGFLLVYILNSFIIPELIDFLEQGGSFLPMLLFLVFIVAVLIARWIVFLYWRLLARRWLRFYKGFMEWGEELERVFSSSSEDNSGGGATW